MTLKDLSDNGTDGEVGGGAKFVDGKIGKAVELDGKDNVVKINKKNGTLEEISSVYWVNSEIDVDSWKGKMERKIPIEPIKTQNEK